MARSILTERPRSIRSTRRHERSPTGGASPRPARRLARRAKGAARTKEAARKRRDHQRPKTRSRARNRSSSSSAESSSGKPAAADVDRNASGAGDAEADGPFQSPTSGTQPAAAGPKAKYRSDVPGVKVSLR